MLFFAITLKPNCSTKASMDLFSIDYDSSFVKCVTKLVHEYVEYGINNQGNADAGNTEYWGEACKIYFAKHRVCYSLHPELFILHLTKGKLWFAWFLLKHSWNNQFGKLNADYHAILLPLKENNSRPLRNWHYIVVL